MNLKWIQKLNSFSLDLLFYTFSFLILHATLSSVGATELVPDGGACAFVLLPGLLWPIIRMKYTQVFSAFFKIRRLAAAKSTLGTIIGLLILFPALGLSNYFLFAGLNLGLFLMLSPLKSVLDRKILLPGGLSPRVFKVFETTRKQKTYERKVI